MQILKLSALLAIAAAPAFAEGDADAGERAFRQCASCHHVVNDEGEVLAGRANTKTGPNLYGIVGAPVAHMGEDFNYGDGILAAHEAGLEWTVEDLVTYVQDPTTWLREATGDNGARSKMSFRVRKAEDAEDIIAYLASLAPAPEEAEESAQ